MDTQDILSQTAGQVRNSPTIKVLSIGILVLILLIPMSMISSLTRERSTRRDTAVQEIEQKWGSSQTITGPFLTVPYRSYYQDEEDRLKYDIRHLHVLPRSLSVEGTIDPEIRYRGIYEAVLYNTELEISGDFTIPSLAQSSVEPENVMWDKAVFSVGITDMRGIQDNVRIRFGDVECRANPGLATLDIAASGLQCPTAVAGEQAESDFSLKLDLNGSEQIHLVPVGETTHLKLESKWPSPSFNGSFLPETRSVEETGFSASWEVLHLNRNYPQFWEGNRFRVDGSAFGVRLLVTADVYQKSTRISKYAIMFIVFTFAAFFFSEVINRKRVHPIQYVLIGLAIALFYVLLLSLSEHLNFDLAYILSAIAITAAITGYSKGILRSNTFTATVCGILVILYAYLYIVLQLEDYALIMGAVGLFIVLSLVMYLTRKIDWYALNEDQED